MRHEQRGASGSAGRSTGRTAPAAQAAHLADDLWAASPRATVAHVSPYCVKLRNWCTALTQADPSPTAAATRLVEPARTLPTAKSPG